MEIEIVFFHSLGNPKGRKLDHFFYASHIRHHFPYKQIQISDQNVNADCIFRPHM